MNFLSIIVGIIVLGACFGLMVWGQKYLGEEKGRNPGGKTGGGEEKDSIDNPCRNCGGCEKKEEKPGGTAL
jgi:hypothetical protein